MPSRTARILGLLPPGTLPVAAGLIAIALGSYLHLAIAGHSLPTSGMAAVSVLWSIAYLLNLGVFLPVEQELARLVAAGRTLGEGVLPVVRRGGVLAAAVLAATLIPVAAAARPLAGSLFGGDVAMVAVLASACVALAVAAVSRGTLAGLGKFRAYGSQLAIDGGLRITLAGALGVAGVRSAAAYGLILTVAPLLGAVATLGPRLGGLRPGPAAASWRAMSSRLGLLIATMLLAQVVMNAAVVLVRLLSPGDAAAVGALLAAFILARVPLFVFASVQAALLPGLSGAIAAGDQARFRQLIARGCGAVTILGVAGGLPVTIGGPWLIQVLFAARPVLGHADFGWLAFGTLFYMLAMVLGQGAMALSRHRALLLSWLAGVLVLALVTITPGDVITRVVIAYAAGSLTAACTLAVVLAQRTASGGGTGSVREYRSTMASSMLSPIAAPASARLPARLPRYSAATTMPPITSQPTTMNGASETGQGGSGTTE